MTADGAAQVGGLRSLDAKLNGRPVIKGIQLVCPNCRDHPCLVAATDVNNCTHCTQCGENFPSWDGKPSFVDRQGSGLSGVWARSHQNQKRLSRWEKAYLALKPPKFAPKRRFSHKALLLDLIDQQRETKVLYVGYNNAFQGVDTSAIVQVDVVPKEYVDVVAMGESLPFPDESFDLVVISQVIEHVTQPFHVVQEAQRVLREGGLLYISSPWMYPFHGGDNYRFSFEGLPLLLKGFANVELGSLDGPAHALAMFLHHWIVNSRNIKNKYVKAGLDLTASWLLLPLRFFDAYTNRRVKERYVLDANIYAVARK